MEIYFIPLHLEHPQKGIQCHFGIREFVWLSPQLVPLKVTKPKNQHSFRGKPIQ